MIKMTRCIRFTPELDKKLRTHAKAARMTVSAYVEPVLMAHLKAEEAKPRVLEYVAPKYYWILYNPDHVPAPEIDQCDFGKLIQEWGVHLNFRNINIGDRVLLYGGRRAKRGVIGCGEVIQGVFERKFHGEPSRAIGVKFDLLIDPEQSDNYLKRSVLMEDKRWKKKNCPVRLLQCNGISIDGDDARYIEERFKLTQKKAA
jgi:hypothetical protein